MRLSLVIPVYDEAQNLRPLYRSLTAVMWRLGQTYEIIFVDDGSTDGSAAKLDDLAARDNAVKVIRFADNCGQTAALKAGIDLASGDVIVTLDGDLQNDPADIPRMLAMLDNGYDLVQGWRKHRQDPFLHRRLPSIIANWLIARVTGVALHDLGCGLKVMRRETARRLPLEGQLHRFIPVLAHGQGARIAEVETHHRARVFGTSKYGLGRTKRVLFDLLAVRSINRRATAVG